ncbi:RNA polymerase sigma factor [Polyangium aurulentum]|uniref:RNA polymerase sigma factor n=1 Tax=Polyangium aurulentum TaxID=2567896 RepID=UPI0010AE417F|nr:sigma-70 family RNA polymerase sigma factor [Polyangium aurulentum]UQA62935.1 sigma-70 family RNA polymerase sigma factor [Polyangium aurulentum]
MGSSDQDSGKKHRLHQLFEKYVDAVRTKLRRLGLEGPDLEDMVQTVYAVAGRRVAKIPKDDEGSRRWLLDAARKHAANWHRLYRHTYETFDFEAIDRATSEPDDPEQYLELRDLVRRTGMRLDPVDREILLRHDLDGESLQEIARWLGLTKSGAHVRLTQARDRFATAFDQVQRKPDRSRGLFLLPALFIDMVRGVCGSWLELLRMPLRWGHFDRLGSLLRSPLQRAQMLSGPVAAVVLAAACPPEEPATPRVLVAVTAQTQVQPVESVVVSLAPPPPPPSAAPPPPRTSATWRRRVAPIQEQKLPPPPPPSVIEEAQPAEQTTEKAPEPVPAEPTPTPTPKPKPKNPYESMEDLAIAHYAMACFHYGNYDAALAWIQFHEIRFPNSQLRHDLRTLARMVAAAPRTYQGSHGKLPRRYEPKLYVQSKRKGMPPPANDVSAPSKASASDAGTDASADAAPDAP